MGIVRRGSLEGDAVLQKPRNAGAYNSRQKPYLQTILSYMQKISPNL